MAAVLALSAPGQALAARAHGTLTIDQPTGAALRRYFAVARVCDACVFTRQVGMASGAPEPASWALMIGGFGVMGTALRRRRPTRA